MKCCGKVTENVFTCVYKHATGVYSYRTEWLLPGAGQAFPLKPRAIVLLVRIKVLGREDAWDLENFCSGLDWGFWVWGSGVEG